MGKIEEAYEASAGASADYAAELEAPEPKPRERVKEITAPKPATHVADGDLYKFLFFAEHVEKLDLMLAGTRAQLGQIPTDQLPNVVNNMATWEAEKLDFTIKRDVKRKEILKEYQIDPSRGDSFNDLGEITRK